MTGLQAASGLTGVRVQYSPIMNLDQAVADSGNVEAIYWDKFRSTIGPRAFKGTTHIKYREEAESDLVIVVVYVSGDKTLEDAEQRAAEMLGEVVKVFQTSQPTSPGSHLHGISAYVSGTEADPGIVSSAGTLVYASSWRVTVHIEANVEQ